MRIFSIFSPSCPVLPDAGGIVSVLLGVASGQSWRGLRAAAFARSAVAPAAPLLPATQGPGTVLLRRLDPPGQWCAAHHDRRTASQREDRAGAAIIMTAPRRHADFRDGSETVECFKEQVTGAVKESTTHTV